MRVVATGNYRHGISTIYRIGRRTPQPGVSVRIKAVVPRKRKGQRTSSVIHLGTTVDGVFLVPQEATLDVHVLEREGVFGADQGRQLAGRNRKSIRGCKFAKGLRQRSVEVTGRPRRVDVRSAQGRECVGAGLNKILEQTFCLLKEKLTVAQTGERMLISREGVVLPEPESADRTRHIDRAERARVEANRIWVGRQRTGHGRCRHGGRCSRRLAGPRRRLIDSRLRDLSRERIWSAAAEACRIGRPCRSDADIEQDPGGDELSREHFLPHVRIASGCVEPGPIRTLRNCYAMRGSSINHSAKEYAVSSPTSSRHVA